MNPALHNILIRGHILYSDATTEVFVSPIKQSPDLACDTCVIHFIKQPIVPDGVEGFRHVKI